MSLLREAKMSGLKAKHQAQADAAEAVRTKAEKKDVKEAKIIKKRAPKVLAKGRNS